MNEREIFIAAAQIGDTKLRRTFLDAICQGDLPLRYRIDKLLEAQAESDQFVERPGRLFEQLAGEMTEPDKSGIAPDEPADARSSSSGHFTPGTPVGPYQIQQLLGEGGMGVVYVAKQSSPVKRQVALKILRPGDNSRNVLARFEQERHALAMMDHPGIAKILDAGTTEDGRPFFVMELVRGIPLNDYCDRENLSPLERLQLFLPVCAAVQHAHQKGIIHRDLKPSNILVALYDGQPIPRVIDFGVAKAVDFRLAEESVYTEVGSIVGTVEYMAPEQAELINLDIDTRADVYALGVVLYELLTGSPPFTRKQLRSAAFDEMLRMIREVDPPKPSTKISSSGEIASIAAHRKLEPRQLTRMLAGDLDWVVMKALAKERDQRYQSASDFSSDISRFLNDEAVEAGPPGVTYRVRKFLQRNRMPAIATGLVLLAIVAGGVAATLGWLESGRQYRLARAAESAERAEREVAEARLKQVENGIQILTSVFNDLNPSQVSATDSGLRTILAERLILAAQQLEEQGVGDPLAVARMQYRLARSLMELGFPQQAAGILEKAESGFLGLHGNSPQELLNCQDSRASCLQDSGDVTAALQLMQKTLAEKKRLLGAAHADTIATMNNIAGVFADTGKFPESVALYTQALELLQSRPEPNPSVTLTTRHNLAGVRLMMGDFQTAIPALEALLEKQKQVLGAEHRDIAATLNSLATALRVAGKSEQGLPLIEEALRINQKVLGPEHPSSLALVLTLATTLQELGKDDQALPFFEQVTRQRRLKLGNEHPETLWAINKLAVALKNAGKLDQARPLYLESLEQRRKILGPEHPDTLTSLNNLGAMYVATKELDLAIPLLEECLVLKRKTVGPDHPTLGSLINNLAKACQDAGQLERAVELYREALEQKERTLGTDHPRTLSGMYNLANALRLQKKFDDAILLFESLLKRGSQREGGMPLDLSTVPELLAGVYLQANRLDEAETQARHVLAEVLEGRGANAVESFRTKAMLGQILVAQGKLVDAEIVVRECLDWQTENQPGGWQEFQTRSFLGSVLLKQEKFAESELLLKEGLDGLRARSTQLPKSNRNKILSDATHHLAQLYRATGRPEEAEQAESSGNSPAAEIR